MSSKSKTISSGISRTGRFVRQAVWLRPLVLAVVLAVVGYWLRTTVENSVKSNMADNLQTILTADVAALELWLQSQKENVAALAEEPDVRRLVGELATMASDPSVDNLDLGQAPQQDALQEQLKMWLEHQGYSGFVIINEQGRVMSSLQKEYIGRDDLPIPDRVIDRVFSGHEMVTPPFRSSMLLTNDQGNVEGGLPTMFGVAPVRNGEGEVVAALGVRIDPEETFTYLLSIAAPGETGETYAFNRDGVMVSKSKFDDKLKQHGILRDEENEKSILNLQIRDPEVNLMRNRRASVRRSEQPLTRMAASAIPLPRGSALESLDKDEMLKVIYDHRLDIDTSLDTSQLREAIQTAGLEAERAAVDVEGYRDYTGVPVIGAWMWLTEYDMGVATEMDLAEAYAPLYVLRGTFWGLFALLALSAVALLIYTAINSKLQWEARKAALEAKELGQYKLGDKLGAGGMGVVYRGQHAMLQRPTAVKLLDPEKTTDAAAARFEREVQATAALNHPNTIAIYDYGRTPEGVFYYAMEFLDGLDLDDLVAKYGPQPAGRVANILMQVCASLHEAHQAGLVHRDIKPGNIFLNDRGAVLDFVKVLDFGLVKAIDTKRQQTLTAAGSFTGTPLYLSPEGINSPEAVDARSDIYAVGAVGYFLLTGQPLFEADSIVKVIMHQVNTTPVVPSERLGCEVDPALEEIIMQCLAKSPADRPQSAKELESALRACAVREEWNDSEADSWWRSHRGEAEPPGNKEPTTKSDTQGLDATMVLQHKEEQ